MSKPTYRAYLVESLPPDSDRKPRWTEIGAVWQHKSGKGFDLILPEGLSVSGRIVCVSPREETPAA